MLWCRWELKTEVQMGFSWTGRPQKEDRYGRCIVIVSLRQTESCCVAQDCFELSITQLGACIRSLCHHTWQEGFIFRAPRESSYLKYKRSWRMDWARIRKQDGMKYSTVWLNWQHVEIVPLCQHKGGRGKRRNTSFHVIHHNKLPFLHRS